MRFSKDEIRKIRAFYVEYGKSHGAVQSLNDFAADLGRSRNVISAAAKRLKLSDRKIDHRIGSKAQVTKNIYTVSKSGNHWEFSGNQRPSFGSHNFKLTLEGVCWDVRRYLYIKHIGKIPTGRVLKRLCTNEKCINPHHAKICTRAEVARCRTDNKLDETLAKCIVLLRGARWSAQELADAFEVHYSGIHNIVNGKKWA